MNPSMSVYIYSCTWHHKWVYRHWIRNVYPQGKHHGMCLWHHE